MEAIKKSERPVGKREGAQLAAVGVSGSHSVLGLDLSGDSVVNPPTIIHYPEHLICVASKKI
jgi:Leucine-rich repeat (LRR) protein